MGVSSGSVEIGIVSGHKEVPVTHLRKLMLEELERRNYSQSTVRTYLMTIEDIARYFHQPPDALGPEQVREYQAYKPFRRRGQAAQRHLAGQRQAVVDRKSGVSGK